MARYVLDTSALMTLLLQEDGFHQVVDLLDRSSRLPNSEDYEILIPFVALMEAEYQLLRRIPEEEVERDIQIIQAWPVEISESNPEWRYHAARLKAPGRLSLADAWIASLAMMVDAELVHKDPEFDGIGGLKALRLPYNQRSPEPA